MLARSFSTSSIKLDAKNKEISTAGVVIASTTKTNEKKLKVKSRFGLPSNNANTSKRGMNRPQSWRSTCASKLSVSTKDLDTAEEWVEELEKFAKAVKQAGPEFIAKKYNRVGDIRAARAC